jgi:hypothetical protein
VTERDSLFLPRTGPAMEVKAPPDDGELGNVVAAAIRGIWWSDVPTDLP